MAITGNKGEWSEMYALLKFLGERKLFAGNENLEKVLDLVYPIVMIIRKEKNGERTYLVDDLNVVIKDSNEKVIIDLPCSKFLQEAEKLFKSIKEKSGTFSVSDTEKFIKSIKCDCLKAKSTEKKDFSIVLYDTMSQMLHGAGFSIKSQLGADSTLLNAGRTTNFIFKVTGASFTQRTIEKINAIDSKKKIIERYEAIRQKGARFEFYGMESEVFYYNLKMMEGDLPIVLASLLIEQLDCEKSELKELTCRVAEKDPLRCGTERSSIFYAYKIKHLLTSIALGLMPGYIWDGHLDANGGYLVIKKDGEILCYHFYDRNLFDNYLFSNAYLERAGSTRHNYGKLERDNNGNLFFKVNLQIRLH